MPPLHAPAQTQLPTVSLSFAPALAGLVLSLGVALLAGGILLGFLQPRYGGRLGLLFAMAVQAGLTLLLPISILTMLGPLAVVVVAGLAAVGALGGMAGSLLRRPPGTDEEEP